MPLYRKFPSYEAAERDNKDQLLRYGTPLRFPRGSCDAEELMHGEYLGEAFCLVLISDRLPHVYVSQEVVGLSQGAILQGHLSLLVILRQV